MGFIKRSRTVLMKEVKERAKLCIKVPLPLPTLVSIVLLLAFVFRYPPQPAPFSLQPIALADFIDWPCSWLERVMPQPSVPCCCHLHDYNHHKCTISPPVHFSLISLLAILIFSSNTLNTDISFCVSIHVTFTGLILILPSTLLFHMTPPSIVLTSTHFTLRL